MEMKTKALFTSVTLVLFLLIAVGLVAADPVGPSTLNEGTSSRGDHDIAGYQLDAYAGNVTELTISSTAITKSWHGYYGNITGYITLDDSSNYTMYNWTLTNPEGEIYASNGTITDWSGAYCANSTTAKNLSAIETWLGMAADDVDGINETFNQTYTDATGFYVGSVQINTADACAMATTFVDETYQDSSFKEVILIVESNVVWTAILEDNIDGFKTGSDPHDFQMLVGENGHSGDTSTTNYYFYVEIE